MQPSAFTSSATRSDATYGTSPTLSTASTQSGHSLINKEAVVWTVARPRQTGWPKLLELRQVLEVLMSDTSTRGSYCEMMGGAVEPLKALSPRPPCVPQSAAPMLDPSIGRRVWLPHRDLTSHLSLEGRT